MNLTIPESDTDPVIHMAFPGSIEDLKELLTVFTYYGEGNNGAGDMA